MKRFLVFKGDEYYPGHGFDDFELDFNDKGSALDFAEAQNFINEERHDYEKPDWVEVFDQEARCSILFKFYGR